MQEHDYRIDYDHPDVEGLMQQIRKRVERRRTSSTSAGVAAAPVRAIRERLELTDDHAFEVQRALDLAGDWNVSPEDLRTSHAGILGRIISACRRLARPALKLAVNADLPLYKQFKINLGVAGALDELRADNDALRQRLAELSSQVEDLTGGSHTDGSLAIASPDRDPSAAAGGAEVAAKSSSVAGQLAKPAP